MYRASSPKLFHDHRSGAAQLYPLGNNMHADKVISEARARIIWGESASSVRHFLTSKGISTVDAEAKIKEFNLERSREIRGIGLRNILIGVAVIGIAGIPLCFIAWPISYGSIYLAKGLAVVVFAALYGLWKLVIGTIYLVRPQFVHKSITDIGESDILE